jgi:hypothetical protein
MQQSTKKIFWIFPSYQFLFLLESRQTVSLTSFYNIVHAFCHLYSHMLQTHLEYFIFEPPLSLPILMTMMNPHSPCVFVVIGPFLSSYNNIELEEVCCTLVVEYTFFKIYSVSLLLLDKTILDFHHFVPCFRSILLI